MTTVSQNVQKREINFYFHTKSHAFKNILIINLLQSKEINMSMSTKNAEHGHFLANMNK